MNNRQITLSINTLVFITFLFLATTGLAFRFSPPSTQLNPAWVSLHNWIGLLMIASISVHLVLHWKWIKSVASRLFTKTSRQARIDFCVDCLMFWVSILIWLSGLIEWLTSSSEGTVYIMHRNTGTALIIYAMLHLALHWKWIVSTLASSFKQKVSNNPFTPRSIKGASQ